MKVPAPATPSAVSRDRQISKRLRADRSCLVDAQPHHESKSYLRLVSHELRTPLNSILGFSEILATELYGPLGAPEYREYANIIRTSGERLLKLVNQVVEIARLQSGDVEIELQPERVAPILEATTQSFASSLSARNLRLRLAADAKLTASTDARALNTVLSHLLQNAVTYAPESSEITLLARHRLGAVEITVRNEGAGFDPADLPRLLQPFQQGGDPLTRSGDGAGLGLAICDLTCEALDGQLELTSAPGEGFAATVTLPAA
jgi:signal transduction histidine kinase